MKTIVRNAKEIVIEDLSNYCSYKCSNGGCYAIVEEMIRIDDNVFECRYVEANGEFGTCCIDGSVPCSVAEEEGCRRCARHLSIDEVADEVYAAIKSGCFVYVDGEEISSGPTCRGCGFCD